VANQMPKFLQLYIHDTDHESDNRLNHFYGLDEGIMTHLKTMMHKSVCRGFQDSVPGNDECQ
jgi:hypothetical protein